jgi:hypothetical protein
MKPFSVAGPWKYKELGLKDKQLTEKDFLQLYFGGIHLPQTPGSHH